MKRGVIMTTSMHLRIDEDTKKEAKILFKHLGMDISTAVNIFHKQSVMEGAFPFQPKYQPKKRVSLKERLKDFDGNFEIEEWDSGEPVGRELI
jgi:DNA-damage-inducible protein J